MNRREGTDAMPRAKYPHPGLTATLSHRMGEGLGVRAGQKNFQRSTFNVQLSTDAGG